MKAKRILLVEDEQNIRDTVQLNLEMEGLEVIPEGNGGNALQVFKSQKFDMVILDVMLPEMDGFQICEKIRLENSRIPILILSAKSSALDRVLGLKKGADDYLTKPFNLEELLLRVHNLLKIKSLGLGDKTDTEEYSFGSNKVNFITFEVDGVNGKTILTSIQARLLKYFIERKNEVLSREEILHAVWDYDVYPTTRTIDNFILQFRKIFEQDPKNPEFFMSIRKVGYKFTDTE